MTRLRRHKYGVAPRAERMVDGITFDSKAEARRFRELQLLERGKRITLFESQPKFEFIYRGEHIFTYRADFRYRDLETGQIVIEDVKGFRTPLYRLKKKLIEAAHGITITEVEP